MPQAPELIEPSVKALDEAIEALEGATQAVENALDACAFDPPNSSAARSGCSPCGRWPQVQRAD